MTQTFKGFYLHTHGNELTNVKISWCKIYITRVSNRNWNYYLSSINV